MNSIPQGTVLVKHTFSAFPQDLSSAMHAALSGGVSLVPVGKDKRPTIKWKEYQGKRASTKMLDHWLATHEAFAMVCGAASGGVELLDFDNNPSAEPQPYTADEFWDAWRTNPHVAPILDRYPFAVQRTGGGGFQVAYRCPNPGGNQKLAWIPDVQEHGRSIAIETRGEGGYAVIAPSLHPSGNYYQMLQGSFADIPTITQQERNALLDAARQLCLMPYTKQEIHTAKKNSASGNSVIEAFNAAHKVRDLLLQHGYTEAGRGRLSRPGQPESAGVAILDSDNVAFPWSSNDPLHRPTNGGNPSPVDPFDVYAFFDHGGDKKSATKAAAKLLGMERTTATPATRQRKIDPDGVIDAPVDVIGAIRKMADKEKIITELAYSIGDMERSQHALVVSALVDVGFGKTEAREFVKACAADGKARQKAERRAKAQAERRDNAIQVNDRQLRDLVADAVDALQAANGDSPKIFTVSGEMARVTDIGVGHEIRTLNDGAILYELADAADWITITVNDEGIEKTRDANPPHDLVAALRNHPSLPFPTLLGITNAPTFAHDGSLHAELGYNPKTKLYNTGKVTLGDTEPTEANIAWAKTLIADLLHDFPFADEASLTHAVSYMILPFVRDMIVGPTPPHDVDAPSEGTGKGLLVAAMAYPFLGTDVQSMGAPENDTDWRKNLTSALMSGTSHILFDNASSLDSASLARATTQAVWRDRILGGSHDTIIPVRVVWAVTSNNIKLSRELARRFVLIRLDASSARPWERRGFKHPDLMAWVRSRRDDLATACMIIVNAWLAAGRPLFTDRVKGSYEQWAAIMGGILQNVGYTDFLGNENKLYEQVETKGGQMLDFVNAWAGKQKEREDEGLDDVSLSAKELFKLASVSDNERDNEIGGWLDLLGDQLGSGNARSRATRLGFILADHRDKVVGDYKILFVKTLAGVKYWRLERQPSDEERLLLELQI